MAAGETGCLLIKNENFSRVDSGLTRPDDPAQTVLPWHAAFATMQARDEAKACYEFQREEDKSAEALEGVTRNP